MTKNYKKFAMSRNKKILLILSVVMMLFAVGHRYDWTWEARSGGIQYLGGDVFITNGFLRVDDITIDGTTITTDAASLLIGDTVTVETSLVLGTGSIVDTGGAISFGANALSTTGYFTGIMQIASGDYIQMADATSIGINPDNGRFVFIDTTIDEIHLETATFDYGANLITGSGHIQAGTLDIGDTNETKFSAAGLQTMTGDARVKKYMTIGAASLVKGTQPPAEGVIGTYSVLLFASNLTETANYNFHIPPDWDDGTDIEIAIYWCPTTSDSGKHVSWEIAWEARSHGVGAAGEILGAGSANVEIHDDTYAGANNLQETSYATIAAGSLVVDDTVGLEISRDHDDGDDYGSDVGLIHIEIDYTIDKLGEAL